MKVLKILSWGISVLLIYVSGFYLLTGTFDTNIISAKFRDIDSLATTEIGIALLTLTLFIFVALPLLYFLWRVVTWLGIFLLFLSSIVAISLSLDVISFEDRRLLPITSSIGASLIVTVIVLSLIAALNVREFRIRVQSNVHLHKLGIRNPEVLLFKSSTRTNAVYVGPAFIFSFAAFTHFYSRYSEASLQDLFDIISYTMIFIVGVALFIYGNIRKNRRVFQ